MDYIDLNAVIQTGHWSHGICGCFDNWTICCITYWVPCVTFGQTVERIQGKSCFLYGFFYFVPGLNCYLLMKQRGLVRELRAIPGSNLSDCCWAAWCTCCTLSQEGQEIEHMKQEFFSNRSVAVIVNQPGYPATATVTTTGYPVNVYGNQQAMPMGYAGQVQQTYPPGQVQQTYPPPAEVTKGDYPEKTEQMDRM